MSVTPHWPSAVTPGLDPQQQYLHVSQAATASLSTTTVYTPQNPQAEGYPSKQFNVVPAHQQQPPSLVQPSFLVTQPQQPMPPTYNPQLFSQGIAGGQQCYQPQPPSTQMLELPQPGAESMVTYQPQQATSMPGVYNPSQPQQQLVVPLVYKVQHPTMTVQNRELQSNQHIQLAYNPHNPPQPTGLPGLGHNVVTNPTYTQSVLNKLIGHEPCIHTLTYLEAQIESQKQIGKSQSAQLKTLWEQSAQQEQHLERLKLECCAKDRTIEALRSQIDASKVVETQKAEVPRLRAVIKEQREELERLHKRSPSGRIKDSQKVGRYAIADGRSLDGPLARRNREVVNVRDKVSRLNLNQRELGRLQQENQAFRLEIGRLERENSEVTRLRVEVLELNRRLREARPRNIPAALDQSVSSTALSGQEVVTVHRPISGDQISFSRTK